MKTSAHGMSKELFEAIKWALEAGKIVADTESGIVTVTRSNKTGWATERGYLRIEFKKDGKRYQPRVHQVIAVAGNLNPVGLTINHKNGIKTDNRLSNLEAITNEENLAHAVRTGLQASKLTKQDVIDIMGLLAKKTLTQKEIGEMFNVTHITISNIKTGRTWSHITESFFNAEKEAQDAQEAEYLHLQELYNNSTNETERKALKRALYSMEVE